MAYIITVYLICQNLKRNRLMPFMNVTRMKSEAINEPRFVSMEARLNILCYLQICSGVTVVFESVSLFYSYIEIMRFLAVFNVIQLTS